MKIFKSLSLLASVTIILTACTATPAEKPEEIAQPACEIADVTYSDAVSSESVEDEYGCYTKLAINPSSPLLERQEALYDLASLEANGFTSEDAYAAQQAASKFFVEETLDSISLDNSAAQDDWVTHIEAEGYFEVSSFEEIKLSIEDSNLKSVGLVVTGSLPEPSKRDNEVRQDSITASVVKVSGTANAAGEPIIVVSLHATMTLSFDDYSMSQWIIKNNSTVTEAELKDRQPELFDDSGLNQLEVTVDSSFSMNDAKITGSTLNYSTSLGK